MTLFVCWVLFPLVLGALALGCGVLLEEVSGLRLPGALVLPVGLAVMVVVAQFATLSEATAELGTPLVLALAIIGLLVGRPWRTRRPEPWAVATALGVFAVFAAPVVLSGGVTFAGYIKLDDTATWLAMTDRVMHHGRSLAGLAPSSYEATLDNYLDQGYPVGGFLPLGIGGELVGRDIAWLFQPYLAFLSAMLALSLYGLVTRALESPWIRFVVVFIASQSALLFGYTLWGGVKEVAAAWAIALVAASVSPLLETRARGTRARIRAARDPSAGMVRAVVPIAVASAATLGVLSFGGAVWLAPILVPALVALVYLGGRLLALRGAISFAALGAALAIPSLVTASVFLRPAGHVLTSESELGNLIRPLRKAQFFGIWPTGDFRVDPADLDVTRVLIVVAVAAGAIGLWWAWRRRAWELILYVGAAVVGTFVIVQVGSPWVDAKALATSCPAPVLAAMLGAAAIWSSGRRVEGGLVALAIAGGVLWSNALAFHEANLAPHNRFSELEQISKRIDGEGPTLMTEYEPYGVRHFLRKADPEGASELRRRIVPLRRGGYLDKLQTADIDEFQLDAVLVYRTLVLRRSPAASRPPSVYRRTWHGRYYDVWQRPPTGGNQIVEHLSLGTVVQPAATPSCGQILDLGRRAGPGGLLATVERPESSIVALSRLAHPSSWHEDTANSSVLVPTGDGTIEATVLLPSTARYGVWIGGAIRGRLVASVDGHQVADDRHDLSHAGQWVPLGQAQLTAGAHRVTMRYDDGVLHPGSGGEVFPLGPLALAEDTVNRRVTYVRGSRAQTLCGKRLDWVEAIR